MGSEGGRGASRNQRLADKGASRKSPGKGATRKQVATSKGGKKRGKQARKWTAPAWLTPVLRGVRILLLLLALGTMLHFIGQWLLLQLDKPVASVKIRGEFALVSREQVADSVYDAMGRSFMTLELQAIKQQLEAQPWIDRVRVERRWPDALEVTVIEHKPIARWGQQDALNHRGEVIVLRDPLQTADVETLLEGLPRLSGPRGMEAVVMAQYQTLSKMLSERNLAITQLHCDASRSWRAVLAGGVELKLGRDEIVARAKRFMTVFDAQLKQRWAELDRIDLRYFNGVAVHWRQADKLLKPAGAR